MKTIYVKFWHRDLGMTLVDITLRRLYDYKYQLLISMFEMEGARSGSRDSGVVGIATSYGLDD
jgi:hypothetical protein